ALVAPLVEDQVGVFRRDRAHRAPASFSLRALRLSTPALQPAASPLRGSSGPVGTCALGSAPRPRARESPPPNPTRCARINRAGAAPLDIPPRPGNTCGKELSA